MKRNKTHRKLGIHKVKSHGINLKFKKAVAKRTRELIEPQDPNRRWEDDSMSRNLVTSTAVSRLNAISTNGNEILNKQREASQAIAQLNTEYIVLRREWKKRDKQIKDDSKVKEKLENIKINRKEQEKLKEGYPLRRKEVDDLE
jgi:hypothetical protein